MDDTQHNADDLRIERHIYIASNAASVWAALVEPDVASRYFVVPLLEAEQRAGGRIAYGRNGTSEMTGTVLECEHERRLVHTFSLKELPEDPPTRVIYELTAIGEMTKLTMIHDGFPERNPTYNEVNGGWNFILSNLKTMLETGRTMPWPTRSTEPL